MSKLRLPDGTVIDSSKAETGQECTRCGEFISLEPVERPYSAAWFDVGSSGYVVTPDSDRHNQKENNLSAILCPKCNDKLAEFLRGGSDDE